LRPVRLTHRVARIAPDEAIVTSLDTVSLRDKAMILLGRLAALRLAEITQLHTDDREADVLRIHGKGDRTRMVPINAELLDVLVRLEHLQGAHGYYFRGSGAREGSHMHKITVSKIISAATGWNPHSLRYAAATAAYEGTHDLRAVQEMLGHTNLMTTQRYVHVRADHIRAAVDATSLGLAGGVTTAIERAG
jgi:integrase/recombinase XerC